MHVMILGSWSDCVGTDYCDYLGEFDSLEDTDAIAAAEDYAWNLWTPQSEMSGEAEDDEDVGFDDEGPDYHLEEYIPGDDGHDSQRAGGGSFQDQIARGW